MPDFLVFCALVPKILGAKVILDQHDPMPELMKTIFGIADSSFSVRVMYWLGRRPGLRRSDRYGQRHISAAVCAEKLPQGQSRSGHERTGRLSPSPV